MSDYIRDMRSKFGSSPIQVCGASIILFDRENRVLMLQRTDNQRWCFPGGAVELGERVEDAARRELLEETGLRVDSLELFGVFSGPELHYRYPNGDQVHIIDTVFVARSFTGELSIDSESRLGKFVPIEEIPDEISPPVIPVVRQLKAALSAAR
jgi:8-oxo-dGTP pyrophosphatase MutT (NUDIX family)